MTKIKLAFFEIVITSLADSLGSLLILLQKFLTTDKLSFLTQSSTSKHS